MSSANRAVAWLELATTQAADGSWGTDSATRFVSTAEVVVALRSFGSWSPSYQRGITWIENHAERNQDELARRILALGPHGDTVSAEEDTLAAGLQPVGQNIGGWAIADWYHQEPLTTALAMRAFDAIGDRALGQPGIGYLKWTRCLPVSGLCLTPPRLADGSWVGTFGSTTGDANTTAEVAFALSAYGSLDSSLGTATLPAAASWLTANVTTASPALSRALTIRALLAIAPGSSSIGTLLNSLVPNTSTSSDQAADGSWGDNALATAVVLEALASTLGRSAITGVVYVPDFQLRRAINLSLGRNAGDALRLVDLRRLTTLQAPYFGITDLTGLGEATNLVHADLSNNMIHTLWPIRGIRPSYLNIEGNPLDNALTADTDGDGLLDVFENGTGIYAYSKSRGTIAVDPDSDDDGWNDRDDDYPQDATHHVAVAPNGKKLDLNRAPEPYNNAPGCAQSPYLGLDDFLLFWKSYQKVDGQSGYLVDADFDGDGDVDAADFQFMQAIFPTCWVPTN